MSPVYVWPAGCGYPAHLSLLGRASFLLPQFPWEGLPSTARGCRGSLPHVGAPVTPAFLPTKRSEDWGRNSEIGRLYYLQVERNIQLCRWNAVRRIFERERSSNISGPMRTGTGRSTGKSRRVGDSCRTVLFPKIRLTAFPDGTIECSVPSLGPYKRPISEFLPQSSLRFVGRNAGVTGAPTCGREPRQPRRGVRRQPLPRKMRQ